MGTAPSLARRHPRSRPSLYLQCNSCAINLCRNLLPSEPFLDIINCNRATFCLEKVLLGGSRRRMRWARGRLKSIRTCRGLDRRSKNSWLPPAQGSSSLRLFYLFPIIITIEHWASGNFPHSAAPSSMANRI